MTPRRIGAAWRRGGASLAMRVAGDRVVDCIVEARLGISAGGLVPIETLVPEWEGCHDYFPTSFRTFRRFMEAIPITPGRDVFIDYGSGKGRVLLLAARVPFRRIIGVEIAPALNAEARANVARARGPLACRDIVLWEGDAAGYALPEDATVVYFFNPFHGPRLAAVLARIRSSIEATPRQIHIAFNNTTHLAKIEDRHSWLHPVARFSADHDCAVYRAGPSGP